MGFDMVSSSLWIGEICMAFGVLAFWFMSLRARPEDKHHYLVSIFIVVIATMSYFAMAIGQTHLTLSDGHAIFIARYLDWAFTTPLLLLGTATIGMRALSVNKTIVYGAIGADVVMIVTGLAGGLSVDHSRWVWYAYSCIAFLVVLALLWGPIRAESRAQGRETPYLRLVVVLTILWIQYPIVWLLGSEGIRSLGPGPETLWYSALDVIAKVAFGFLSLATVAKLAPAIEEGGTIVSSVDERRIRSAAR
ncbi:MAG: bacteriorhodopsin [Vulcanimicrobiaceae bacterium]